MSEYMETAAAKKVAQEFLDQSFQVTQNREKEAIEEEEGEDLCDCTFSLAYGAKILLNNTRLRLKKGRRYGLCGPNGAGKVGGRRLADDRCLYPPSSLSLHKHPQAPARQQVTEFQREESTCGLQVRQDC